MHDSLYLSLDCFAPHAKRSLRAQSQHPCTKVLRRVCCHTLMFSICSQFLHPFVRIVLTKGPYMYTPVSGIRPSTVFLADLSDVHDALSERLFQNRWAPHILMYAFVVQREALRIRFVSCLSVRCDLLFLACMLLCHSAFRRIS